MKLVSFVKDALSSAAAVLTSKEGLKGLYGGFPYRNGACLMLNSVAITGFFIWVLVARLYPAEALICSSGDPMIQPNIARILLVKIFEYIGD